MLVDEPQVPHRERVRARTMAEIRQHAYDQLARGGVDALSLNAIAKDMGMSGPGLYRYYPSRDGLLAALVTESYADLADGLDAAVGLADRQSPPQRLRAVAEAYRRWAIENPHRYRLVFTSYGTGAIDPDAIVPASQRSMNTLLSAISDIAEASTSGGCHDGICPPELDAQLEAWALADPDAGPPLPPSILLAGLLTWSRLHGLVMLEIDGFYEQIQIDPVHLYRTEVDRLIALASNS